MKFASKRLAHIALLSCSLGCAIAVTACGGSDDASTPEGSTDLAPGAPSGGPGEPPPASAATPAPSAEQPATAPKVLSSTPAANATGVKSDAKIVIKFDQPMDETSVAAAYASMELPSEKVSLAWNAESDELTITPSSPLAYATGADPQQLGANGYAVLVGKQAKSKKGLAMSDDFSLSFTTLRRIKAQPPRMVDLSGRVLSNGSTSTVSFWVGDDWNGAEERSSRGFLTFDLASIPADAEIEKAHVSMPEKTIMGTPDEQLGALSMQQVFFSTLDMSAYSAEPVSAVTVNRVGQLAAFTRVADTTSIVKDDLANRVARENRTQLRLGYATAANGDNADDWVTLELTDTKFYVTYLVP